MWRNRHREAIAEADSNPDRWYELFVDQGADTGTHTVESAATFDEIILHIETYADKCGLDNMNIDIWECREAPRELMVTLFDTNKVTIQPLNVEYRLSEACIVRK